MYGIPLCNYLEQNPSLDRVCAQLTTNLFHRPLPLPMLHGLSATHGSIPKRYQYLRPHPSFATAKGVWSQARTRLLHTISSFKWQADRCHSAAPRYRVGQRVKLAPLDVPIKTAFHKLSLRIIGLFIR